LQTQLFLHTAEQIEGLKRRHVVKVGRLKPFLQRRKERILKLEERKLQRTVALYPALLYVMRLYRMFLFPSGLSRDIDQ
jgi:hypothetical protein